MHIPYFIMFTYNMGDPIRQWTVLPDKRVFPAAVDCYGDGARRHARHEISHLPFRVSSACLGSISHDVWPVL